MVGSKNALPCAPAQSSLAQFVSPADRKAIVAKAEALQASKDLKPLDVDLLRWLLFRAPDRFSGFWRFSHEELSAAVGMCEKAVKAALKRLKDAGLLQWKRRFVGGPCSVRSLPNGYSFPAEAFRLSCDALRRLRRAARAAFDWDALKRDRQKVARASLPVPPAAAVSVADPPRPSPAPMRFGAGLLAFCERMASDVR